MRRIRVLFGLVFLTIILTILIASRVEMARTSNEWNAKVSRERSPIERRAILNALMEEGRHGNAPGFIPERMWDDAVCAAAVINAVNFILGTEQLVPAPAWLFGSANTSKLRTVLSRDGHFSVIDGKIVETFDRRVYLSSLVHLIGERSERTNSRMVIVGYHYTQTRADSQIIASRPLGGGWNSHLLLVLGREDGSWWGYHLFHRPEEPLGNPFRVDRLGEAMPPQFDLVYLWEILGTDLPPTANRLEFVQLARPYQAIQPYLRLLPFGGRRASDTVDGAMMAFFGDPEQFPVLRTPRGTLTTASFTK